MDLGNYRASPREQERIAGILGMLPQKVESLLDVGARDGYLSVSALSCAERVTALDTERPDIRHDRVTPARGDICALPYPDASFDVVLCAEVLEHIAPPFLGKACAELVRVSRRHVLVGVPYEQDTRFRRTTCRSCRRRNPPWGHVNAFTEKRIRALFRGLIAEAVSFSGKDRRRTNPPAAFLMDLAGNPSGTYYQDEPCIHCGAKLGQPPPPRGARRILMQCASSLNRFQARLSAPRPVWIHILFRKDDPVAKV